MKTIKLIDLFIKIANGEDTPNAIKFAGKIFTHNGTGLNSNYYCGETDKILEDSFVFEELNEEVEIIEDTSEEDEKIEKLAQRIDTGLFGSQIKNEIEVANTINKQANYLSEIVSKINEIIDKINGGENE